MHKKLEDELVSLAHSILQMKNRDNVYALQEKAAKIYEQLTILKFVEETTGKTSDLKETKAEVLANEIAVNEAPNIEVPEKVETVANIENELAEGVEKVQEVVQEVPEVVVQIEADVPVEKEEKSVEIPVSAKGQISEETAEKIFGNEQAMIKNDPQDVGAVQLSLDEEIKEAISADLATSMFESATKETPVFVKPEPPKKRSLNDAVQSSNLQIGLNDRIAFVKYLFDDSQEDFNRVVSQLNSFTSEEEAKEFVENFVKPDYNWEGKEDYEARLLVLIERRFA